MHLRRFRWSVLLLLAVVCRGGETRYGSIRRRDRYSASRVPFERGRFHPPTWRIQSDGVADSRGKPVFVGARRGGPGGGK